MSYGVPGVIKVKVVSHHQLDKEKEISITNDTTLKSFLSSCSSKLSNPMLSFLMYRYSSKEDLYPQRSGNY